MNIGDIYQGVWQGVASSATISLLPAILTDTQTFQIMDIYTEDGSAVFNLGRFDGTNEDYFAVNENESYLGFNLLENSDSYLILQNANGDTATFSYFGKVVR